MENWTDDMFFAVLMGVIVASLPWIFEYVLAAIQIYALPTSEVY